MRHLITNAYCKDAVLNPLDPDKKQDVQKFAKKLGKYNVSVSIEEFLIRLNSVKNYEKIPDSIVFNYGQLLDRNLDLKNTVDMINLNINLLAEKFNKKTKNVVFTGFVTTHKISTVDRQRLLFAGFHGCTLAPSIHGNEHAMETVNMARKDPDYWPSESLIDHGSSLILPKVPQVFAEKLKIKLTFRQEQITKMIVHRGLTNGQIAKALNISASTTKFHIGIILKKYGLQSRTQLTALLKENW